MSNRTFRSGRRLEARDRRLAAIHEAGHVTMGRHIGLSRISAWLEKTPNPEPWDKVWIGHTRFLEGRLSKTVRPRLSKGFFQREYAMFAVAGAVAERCWQHCDFEDALELWDDPDSMSESDWAECCCQPGYPTRELINVINEVFSLFDRKTGKLWPALLAEARELIVDSRPSSRSLGRPDKTFTACAGPIYGRDRDEAAHEWPSHST